MTANQLCSKWSSRACWLWHVELTKVLENSKLWQNRKNGTKTFICFQQRFCLSGLWLQQDFYSILDCLTSSCECCSKQLVTFLFYYRPASKSQCHIIAICAVMGWFPLWSTYRVDSVILTRMGKLFKTREQRCIKVKPYCVWYLFQHLSELVIFSLGGEAL